jgi:hypothetical protein
MTIITFILGGVCGFFIKLGFDWYHTYLNESLKIKADMEEVLYKFNKMADEKKI